MADAAAAARGVYKPRRPQASPLLRLVSDHPHRLQTVYDERFAREYQEHRELEALEVHFTGLPEKQFWGVILATMQDPPGNELQIVQHSTEA